jgi:predicted secreted Zn-dependent protease
VKSSSTAESSPHHAGIAIVDATRRYVVTGSSHSQIADAIRIGAPAACGHGNAGFTRWVIRWALVPKDGRAHAVSVTLEIETTLPRWIPLRSASAELHREWSEYLAGLEHHESGHRAIAVRAAERVRDALLRYREQPYDGALDERVRREVEAILDEAHAEDARYDAATAQGARDPRVGGRFDRGAASDWARAAS